MRSLKKRDLYRWFVFKNFMVSRSSKKRDRWKRGKRGKRERKGIEKT